MRKEDKRKEWLTGVMFGLIIAILMMIGMMRSAFAEEVEIPEEVEFWAEFYGDQYGIAPEVIEAVCWVESRCDNTAQDPTKRCKGLMQIKPSCHQERMNRCKVRNIFSIDGNIHVGTDYLAELGGKEDIAVALAIYNGQSDAKIKAAREGKYSGYVKEVLEISEDLERKHNK